VVDLGDRVVGAPLGPEPVGDRLEAGLEDRFQHQLERRLDDPVRDRRNTEATPITLAAPPVQAAAIVAEATGLGFLTAALLVDVVDIVTAAILGSVGLDAVEIRRAVATLWGDR
jgi:hypothetical protein